MRYIDLRVSVVEAEEWRQGLDVVEAVGGLIDLGWRFWRGRCFRSDWVFSARGVVVSAWAMGESAIEVVAIAYEMVEMAAGLAEPCFD